MRIMDDSIFGSMLRLTYKEERAWNNLLRAKTIRKVKKWASSFNRYENRFQKLQDLVGTKIDDNMVIWR